MSFPKIHTDGEVWDGNALTDLEARIAAALAAIPAGPIGPAGPQGLPGPQGPGVNWQGAWSSLTTYGIGDGVSRGNDLFVSNTANNLNHDPLLDTVNWTRSQNNNPGRTILTKYGISALNTVATGSTSATGQKNVTTDSAHDFQVGHGIRIVGAGATAPAAGLTPAAPTIANVGTPGATNHTYEVAAILNGTSEFCTPASPPGTTATGAATLNTTNYNTVKWALTGSGNQAYAIYGRAGGAEALLGLAWFLPPNSFTAANVAAGAAPPYLGSNLAISTLYTYTITGIDWVGNETPVLATAAATTGSTVYGINLNWTTYYQYYPYLNIYRNGNFLAKVPFTDGVYQDNALLATTSQTPPTVMTFQDVGQAALQGMVGVPPHVPLTPPAAATNTPLVTSVTAVADNTHLTLNTAATPQLASATLYHDDTQALITALNTEGSVTLPPGVYHVNPMYLNTYVQTGKGLALRGTGGGAGTGSPVGGLTASVNPVPTGAQTILAFTAFSTNAGRVIQLNNGATVENLTLWWPFQTNGLGANRSDGKPTNAIPYPPVLNGGYGTTGVQIRNIVDCNSWIAIVNLAGDSEIENVMSGSIRWPVMNQASQVRIDNIFGSPTTVYSTSGGAYFRAADASAVRTFGGASLLTIGRIRWDHAHAVHFTNTYGGTLGGGGIGCTIDNSWSDDVSGLTIPHGFILDCPVSDPYSTSGFNYQNFLTNIYCVPGGGGVVCSVPGYALNGSGINGVVTEISNSYLYSGATINGQMTLMVSNTWLRGPITCNPTTLLTTITPLQRVYLSNCTYEASRFTIQAANTGRVKAFVSNTTTHIRNRSGIDTPNSGTLNVLDQQGKASRTVTLRAGTTLSAGTPITVDYIDVPKVVSGYGGATANYIYIESVRATGTSATDTWSIDGTPVVTTAGSASGRYIGAAGELAAPTDTALLVVQNPTGTANTFTSLPVAFTPQTNGTLATDVHIDIDYCVSPYNA